MAAIFLLPMLVQCSGAKPEESRNTFAGNKNLVQVRLSPGETKTKEGFGIEMSGGLVNYKTPRGTPYRMIWWGAVVPNKINGVRLDDVQFQTLDKDNRPICFVSMGKGSEPDERGMRSFSIYVEPNHANSCELVFRYWNGSIKKGDIITEYTVPLKDHVLAAMQKNRDRP